MTKYIILFAILTLGSFSSAAYCQDAAEVLDREQARINYLATQQYDLLADMLSPTLTYTHSNAILETKEEFLCQLRNGNVIYKDLNHRDVQVRFVSPNTVILNGITDASVIVKGEEQQVPLRFTIVYVKQNDEWLFEAWHSVRRPDIGTE